MEPGAKRQRALKYIKENGEQLQQALTAAVNAAISANATEPLSFITEELNKIITAKNHTGMQTKSQDAKCMLDHCSKLDIYSAPQRERYTSIICTIGPKTESVEKLTMLRTCGMTIMRMNFSHGSYDEQGARIINLRNSCKVRCAAEGFFRGGWVRGVGVAL